MKSSSSEYYVGLDKWIKTDKEVKKRKTEKQGADPSEPPEKTLKVKKKPEGLTLKLVKQTLTCPNAKCKYQRIIMKKQITEKDKICPRCSTEMKIKKKK